MDSPDPPAAPDPTATAKAQAGSNVATAVANQSINAVNKYTPEGSLVYNQTGTQELSDGFGGSITAPKFESVQTYSPAQQKIYDTSVQTKQNIADIGRDQSARIGSLLGTPINLSNDAVEGRLFDLGRKRLDPQFARDEESLRTRLANGGIRQGSDAWNAEMQRLGQTKNDALDTLLLKGRGQAVQETLAERNQPINEISALLSGSQVSQPNFAAAPQGAVGGVDYGSLVQNKYNADMQGYNTQMSQNNAMMGGLFGLAAAPFSMFRMSDRRVKRNIEPLGVIDGLKVYRYRYKWSDQRHIGVMADEVQHLPGVVMTGAMGVKMVNYERLAEAA